MAEGEAGTGQVGGDHYASEYHHWDFIEANGIGYLEAAATKYVCRWRAKGGRMDLEKAVHYVEKLEELHGAGKRLPRGCAPVYDVLNFAMANGLSEIEHRIVQRLTRWCELEHLARAREDILLLIEQSDKEDHTGQDHPFGFDAAQDTAP